VIVGAGDPVALHFSMTSEFSTKYIGVAGRVRISDGGRLAVFPGELGVVVISIEEAVLSDAETACSLTSLTPVTVAAAVEVEGGFVFMNRCKRKAGLWLNTGGVAADVVEDVTNELDSAVNPDEKL
jgi:hypothetical protein